MLRARLQVVGPPLLFVAIAISLTWISAAALSGAFGDPAAEPSASGLLRASLVYAAVVGWQPLVAFALVRRLERQRSIDYGLRPAAPGCSLLSIAVAIAVLAAAALVDAVLTRSSHPVPWPAAAGASWVTALSSVAAFAGVVAVLWLQAVAEELAWRGYLLARLMRALGPWPGLILHGALWGLCYAPVFVVVGGMQSLDRVAAFVVTCSLLGVILGWLRLASGSIYASAASNATLTICAGLPLVLQGASSYLVAVFEPVGWLALLAAIGVFASRASWRSRIVVPSRRMPEHVN
jgi:membrane protease YdiL (CAAX protease family)